ncbi:hypothetical protein J2T57_001242 [Natronocella acetinitrilica]|uniref:Uncharacterized protein n=1 Tax=Natronocella acetinitrilica TaxID=414046 RepID=A0AAE3G1L5_9GAMM|nr:hypothetical protein [Natronocella acetinitrilica]MCP1674140.1 hypothetical protein [Natronocella acetinitrilica]
MAQGRTTSYAAHTGSADHLPPLALARQISAVSDAQILRACSARWEARDPAAADEPSPMTCTLRVHLGSLPYEAAARFRSMVDDGRAPRYMRLSEDSALIEVSNTVDHAHYRSSALDVEEMIEGRLLRAWQRERDHVVGLSTAALNDTADGAERTARTLGVLERLGLSRTRQRAVPAAESGPGR